MRGYSSPRAPDHGSRRIPRPMDLVFIFLQPNQPPTADAHRQKHTATAKHTAYYRCEKTTTTHCHADARSSAKYEQDCEYNMGFPRNVFQMSSEDREEAEDLDAEEGEGEDVGCGREARSEHRGGHKGGVCGKRSGKSNCTLC